MKSLWTRTRHCEEQRDEASQSCATRGLDRFAALAMTQIVLGGFE